MTTNTPTVPLDDKAASLRTVAEQLRHNPTAIPAARLAVMVADWIDAEAAVLSQLEPFTDLINAAISSENHEATSTIKFGRTETGEIAMRADTSDHAARIGTALTEALATNDDEDLLDGVDELLGRAHAAYRGATEGPWEAYTVPGHQGAGPYSAVEIGDHEVRFDWPNGAGLDAHFTAQARTLVPELAAELERVAGMVKSVLDRHTKKPIYHHTYNGDGTLISMTVGDYYCAECMTARAEHCPGCENGDEHDNCDGLHNPDHYRWPCARRRELAAGNPHREDKEG